MSIESIFELSTPSVSSLQVHSCLLIAQAMALALALVAILELFILK